MRINPSRSAYQPSFYEVIERAWVNSEDLSLPILSRSSTRFSNSCGGALNSPKGAAAMYWRKRRSTDFRALSRLGLS